MKIFYKLNTYFWIELITNKGMRPKRVKNGPTKPTKMDIFWFSDPLIMGERQLSQMKNSNYNPNELGMIIWIDDCTRNRVRIVCARCLNSGTVKQKQVFLWCSLPPEDETNWVIKNTWINSLHMSYITRPKLVLILCVL